MNSTLMTCAGCGAPSDFDFSHDDPRDDPLCGTCMIASARRRGMRIGTLRGMIGTSVILLCAFILFHAMVVPAAVPRQGCSTYVDDGLT